MGRSAVFFTFALAAFGCGSDPATSSALEDAEREQEQGDAIETDVRPPATFRIDRVAPVQDPRTAPESERTAGSFSSAAVLRAPYTVHCPSPSLCSEVAHR